jgi:heme/copper-type cytochrome/quinol oxidase subunit 2
MWMDGWDWFWMSFMMVFWIVVLGAVVYVAVRLANRRQTNAGELVSVGGQPALAPAGCLMRPGAVPVPVASS